MAEIDESVSYLKALKHFSGAHDGTAAPAPVTHPAAHPAPERKPANPSEHFHGPEKRRSTRYQCAGSAELREDGTDAHTWATFTDISLHGCYVEAQSSYPVGTVLHLKLETNGVRVESKGSVRVSYPHLGMGIAFVDVSQETRERLREMLGTLSRPTAIMGPGIASSLPARGLLDPLPPITDAKAAVHALVEFFESRQLLMRDDFVRILHKSQGTHPKP